MFSKMRKYRALGDVDLKFIRLEHAVSHTCGPRLDELVDDPFGLSEDLEIGGTVAFGDRHDGRSPNHNRLRVPLVRACPHKATRYGSSHALAHTPARGHQTMIRIKDLDGLQAKIPSPLGP